MGLTEPVFLFCLQVMPYILSLCDHAGANAWAKLMDIRYTQLLISVWSIYRIKGMHSPWASVQPYFKPTPPQGENT